VTAWIGTIAFQRYAVDDPVLYNPNVLFEVHRDLIRMCAARGDAHAVLGLPEHFREDAAAEYVDTLSSAIALTDDERALSYAAVWHPWTIVRETPGRSDLATWPVPPDGSVCGTIAARTLRNGAWYSSANQLLIGALALSPDLEDVALSLLAARVNPIVQQPRGFVAMDEVTLCRGDEFGALHVRRLLILLRRLALREGAAYVFQSNDDALRRLAERQFEEVLGDLFVRGAFAGTRHEEGYLVVADDTVNTQQGRDNGRFVVELRVAPSRPLMFLTVRLVQEGGAWQASEEP
jgi:phage tail sheath protein FI